MSELLAQEFMAPDGIIAESSGYCARTLLPHEFVSRAAEFAHYP